MTDPERHDFSNIRNKVYDREELQGVLFGSAGPPPYPLLQRIDKQAMTLEKFL
ncbi:hypothetical protein TRSC58_00201 [Trypanosoma rangeli SC58]|uniref:Uncharacterized protein n=1 Tax=Trypanosoma rangeli SC58 TaxID=429131 RepID=A0A061JEM5_TRYRA|nr:hypothetical protein TRSC58_00201 [Trypanosoma rangeli SC58]